MSCFNTFNTFAPFSHSSSINPTIINAYYSLSTRNSVQIKNISGSFTSLNVIRTNLMNNTVYNVIVNFTTNGMTYIDSSVSPNQLYSYQLQPIIGSVYGLVYLISGKIGTLVNNYNIIDNLGLCCYYSFENPAVFSGTGPIITQGNLYNSVIDNSGLTMYFNNDYIYQQY